MDYPFVKGMVLAERLYHEGVKPVMARHFPKLRYSAARLGQGSDTLGYDTPASMGHGWGPILEIYLSPEDHGTYAEQIVEMLRHELPREVAGVPTNFVPTLNNQTMVGFRESGPIDHGVLCVTIGDLVVSHRSFNPNRELTALDWLTMPQQALRQIRSGRVFHDGLGELEPLREKLHWYPDDIWYYLLSAQWDRFTRDPSFVVRCGEVGDELGSRVLAARLIKSMMFLCFLMERQYAPYAKWFGTAFAELHCGADLVPVFQAALDAQTWRQRETHMSQAYEYVARMHNSLGITEPVPPEVVPFFEGPSLVPPAAAMARAIYDRITSEEVKQLPRDVGSIDQLTSFDCLLRWPSRKARLVGLYEGNWRGIGDSGAIHR